MESTRGELLFLPANTTGDTLPRSTRPRRPRPRPGGGIEAGQICLVGPESGPGIELLGVAVVDLLQDLVGQAEAVDAPTALSRDVAEVVGEVLVPGLQAAVVDAVAVRARRAVGAVGRGRRDAR